MRRQITEETTATRVTDTQLRAADIFPTAPLFAVSVDKLVGIMTSFVILCCSLPPLAEAVMGTHVIFKLSHCTATFPFVPNATVIVPLSPTIVIGAPWAVSVTGC